MKMFKIFISLTILLTALALLFSPVNAGIINYGKSPEERWKHVDAYRPKPVLFLHGFASGSYEATWIERDKQKESEKPKVDLKLEPYFKSYYNPIELIDQNKPVALKDFTRFPYLELISFIDFTKNWRSQLIDRNSSVDTYQASDYYVSTNERFVNDPGWSDKVQGAIEKLRENYKDKNGKPLKVILVCHSMGGLAAREYLTRPIYSNASDKIEKLILIGVPNLGSPFAKLADGITRSRRVGWFMPGIGWIFSSEIGTLDRFVFKKGGLDIDGDAVRDMDPGPSGSGFLNILNNRAQSADIDYFVIWGNGNKTDTLIGRVLYFGSGDGVVSKDSQLGTNKLSLKASIEVKASHGNEAAAAVTDTIIDDPTKPTKPLLKFLDYTKPEVTITLPDPNANPIPEINTSSINIKGAISKEYLPADCILKIQATREEDSITETKKEDKLLYPSDQWNPDDTNSIIAEFDEKIEFNKPGTYTILVTVVNPAGIASDVKTTKVKVILRKPIISIFPITSTTNRRPEIKAWIDSPDNVNIDLSSIQLKLDGSVVTHMVSPSAGGPHITITYIPPNDLSVNNPDTPGVNEGKHTIIVNAKDIAGLVADEKTHTFRVYSFCPPEIVKYMRAINEREKTVGLTQTKFYKHLSTDIPLGTPDGGVNVPSLDALADAPFISRYIDDIRAAIKKIIDNQDEYENTGAYWDTTTDTKWTLETLYKAAMNTSGSGPGLSTWTHTSSQVAANGVETIDIEELQKCIMKLDRLRLPVTGSSSIANYFWYSIIDYGWWNGNQYTPDGIGDKLFYSGLLLGDQGWSGPGSPQHYNSTTRAFFGGNIEKLSNFTLYEVFLHITVSINEGDPTSLGACHLGHFLPNVNKSDFQKPVEAEIVTVPVAAGTYIFTVTPYVQADINAERKESWYKGWFDNLTDYDKNGDRVKWWPIKFIIRPSFRNP